MLTVDSFGIASCADGGGSQVLIDPPNTDTEIVFQYDATGELQAVIEYDYVADAAATLRCLAGPTTYAPPSNCRSALVGYACVRDAGAD